MVHGPWARNTIFQLALLGTCQGQRIANVFHFEASAALEATLTSDALAQAEGNVLANDFRTNVQTAWLDCHTNDYTLDAYRAQVLERPARRSARLTATEITTGLPAAGTRPTPAGDMVSAVVIRWRTPVAGKSHRGRTYIGPIYDAADEGGRLAVAQQPFFNNFRTAFFDRYGQPGTAGTPWEFTIYSRPYDAGEYQYVRRVGGSLQVITPPDYDGNSTFVTSSVLDTILRAQRRRELGVGA